MKLSEHDQIIGYVDAGDGVHEHDITDEVAQLEAALAKWEDIGPDVSDAADYWEAKYNEAKAQVEALQKKLAHERGCDECWKEHGKFGTCGSDCLMADALLEADDE